MCGERLRRYDLTNPEHIAYECSGRQAPLEMSYLFAFGR